MNLSDWRSYFPSVERQLFQATVAVAANTRAVAIFFSRVCLSVCLVPGALLEALFHVRRCFRYVLQNI